MLVKIAISVLAIFFVSGCASGGAPATQVSVDYDDSANWTADQGADLFLNMLRRQQNIWDHGTHENSIMRHHNRSDDNISLESVDTGYSGRAHLYNYRISRLLGRDSYFYFTMSVDEGALLTAYSFDYINRSIANMVGVTRGTRPMYVAHIPGASLCWGASQDRPSQTRQGWALPVVERKYSPETRQIHHYGAVCFGGDPRFNESYFIESVVRRGGASIDGFNRADGIFVFETRAELLRFTEYMSSVYGVRVADPI